MANYKIVLKKNHKDFKFKNVSDFSFTKAQNNCPICLDEIRNILLAQAIVFLKEQDGSFGLYAIQGLENRQNLYVNKNGKWMTNYIPAYYRMQPFKFIMESKNKELVLCYDEELKFLGKNLNEKDSSFLFDKKANPTPEFLKIISLAKRYHENLKTTQEIVSTLSEMNLIEEWPITVRYSGKGDKKEEDKKIEGIHRINEEKFKNLNSKDLYSLFEIGSLELAYCQLFSMKNISFLKQLHSQSNVSYKLISSGKSLRDKAIEKQKKVEVEEVNNLVSDLLSEE